MKNKKGNVNITALITAVILIIVAIVVIFFLVGSTAPTLTEAADNISGSGLPLASLFASGGIVLLIFMAGVLITVIVLSLKMAKGGQ